MIINRHIGYYIKCINNSMEANKNRDLQSFGLTSQQFSILMFLNDNISKDIYQKDIEKYFDLSGPTVSGILQRLEAKDYIYRKTSSKDLRYKTIVPTVKGLEFKEIISKRIDEDEKKILAGVSEEDVLTFMAVLAKIKDNVIKEK